jgi:hypothetical protein
VPWYRTVIKVWKNKWVVNGKATYRNLFKYIPIRLSFRGELKTRSGRVIKIVRYHGTFAAKKILKILKKSRKELSISFIKTMKILAIFKNSKIKNYCSFVWSD